AGRFHRRLRSHRLDLQCLPAGRMAGGGPRDHEFRLAFWRHQWRHTGEPAEPAHQSRVGNQPDIHGANWLFALLYAAAAHPGGEFQFDRRPGRYRCDPPEVTQNDSVRAERSHYFDAGVTVKPLPGLTLGLDAYYRIVQNMLDFGLETGQA